MKTRELDIPNLACLVLGSLLLLVALAGSAAADEKQVTVKLKGGHTVENATIRPSSDCRYLIISEGDVYECPVDQIVSVDGEPGVPEPEGGWSRLIDFRTYEELQPGGEVVVWSDVRTKNHSGAMITSLDWGAAEHELEAYETLQVHDRYGNLLTHRIEPRSGKPGFYRVTVDFAVPVAPGEEFEYSLRRVVKDMTWKEDDLWVCNMNGDFPDDRLYLRKLVLPEGAEIVETTSNPRRFEHDGRTMLVWWQYYPKREVVPLTVKYRLGD